jgi:transcriptional repressor NrdR
VHCPACHSPTNVLETRPLRDRNGVRRRRRCRSCETRFTTVERVDRGPLYVRKRNGRRQRFDPVKLRAALLGAAHKRPVSAADVERLVERVEAAIADAGGELAAERVGQLCLRDLHDLDRGAYLQFAGTLPGSVPEFAASDAGRSVRAASDPA